jgi:alkylhydroperoxidase family enzyme
MRLRYVKDPQEVSDNEIKALLTRLNSSGDKGQVGPLYQTLAHSPTIFAGFLKFFGAIRYESTLPLDIMELAMCRVGALNGAAFEWMHHAPLLEEAGVSEEGVETVRTAMAGYVGKEGEKGLSAKHWAVLRFVDCMTRDIKVPDEVFDAVRRILSEQQIVELGGYS